VVQVSFDHVLDLRLVQQAALILVDMLEHFRQNGLHLRFLFVTHCSLPADIHSVQCYRGPGCMDGRPTLIVVIGVASNGALAPVSLDSWRLCIYTNLEISILSITPVSSDRLLVNITHLSVPATDSQSVKSA